jgi:hypothetical protein
MTSGKVRLGNSKVPYAGAIQFGWPARRIKPQPFIYQALDPKRAEIAKLYAIRIDQLVTKYDLAGNSPTRDMTRVRANS